jgi:CRP-like cAMP-binding protein
MISPSLQRQELAENRLLSSLPQLEREHLLALMQTVCLRPKQIIQLSGESIGMVYFPITAVLSLVAILTDGSSTELGTISHEGMAGLPALLGAGAQPFEMIVQIAGTAHRMHSSALSNEARICPLLEDWLLRYTQVFLDQIAQGVACRGHHSVKQRLARSLLTAHDSVQADRFQLTQEFLGQLLGVGRPSVSLAAEALQQTGLIKYCRGAITVIDRPRLEEATCECYHVIREEYDRLFSLGEVPLLESANYVAPT